MIPMGVKYNHTKFERETQWWRPGTGFASGGPEFQKLQFRAKNSHFWAKKEELVDTGKSSRMWSVPTVSLCLAVLNVFQGGV